MRFRTVVIAAVVLVLAATGAFAAYTVSDLARDEAAQNKIDESDSLAVESNITQKLIPADDHDPTAYGNEVTVTYNDTEWESDGNYSYYNATGEIEFLRDEPGEATIDYSYEIPENQVADEQLQTTTISFGLAMRVVIGMTFVVLLLFIGAFVYRKMRVSNTVRGR